MAGRSMGAKRQHNGRRASAAGSGFTKATTQRGEPGATIPPPKVDHQWGENQRPPPPVYAKRMFAGWVDRVYWRHDTADREYYQAHVRLHDDALAELAENDEWNDADNVYPFFTYSTNIARSARDRRTSVVVAQYANINEKYGPELHLPLVRHGMKFTARYVQRCTAKPDYWEFFDIKLDMNKSASPLLVAVPVVVTVQGRAPADHEYDAQRDEVGYQRYSTNWRSLRLRVAFTPHRYKELPELGAGERNDCGPERLAFAHREYTMPGNPIPSAGMLGIAHVEFHDLNNDVFDNVYYAHVYGVFLLEKSALEDFYFHDPHEVSLNRVHPPHLRTKYVMLAAAYMYHESLLRFRATRATAVRALIEWEATDTGTKACITINRPDLADAVNDEQEQMDEQQRRANAQINALPQLLVGAGPMSVLTLTKAMPYDDRPDPTQPKLQLRVATIEISPERAVIVGNLDLKLSQAPLLAELENGDYMVRTTNESPNYVRSMRSLQGAIEHLNEGWRPSNIRSGNVLKLGDQIAIAIVYDDRLSDTFTQWSHIRATAAPLEDEIRQGTSEALLVSEPGEFKPLGGQAKTLAAVLAALKLAWPLLLMCDSPFGTGKTTVQNQVVYMCSLYFNQFNGRPFPDSNSTLSSDITSNAKYHSTIVTCTVNSATDESARRAVQNMRRTGCDGVHEAVRRLLLGRKQWSELPAAQVKDMLQEPGYIEYLKLRAAFAVRVLSPLLETQEVYSDLAVDDLPALHKIAQDTPFSVARADAQWVELVDQYWAVKTEYETVHSIVAGPNQTPQQVMKALMEQVPHLVVTGEDDDEEWDDDNDEVVAGRTGVDVNDPDLEDTDWGRVLRRAARRYAKGTVKLHKYVLDLLQPGQIHVTVDSTHDVRIKHIRYCAMTVDEASLVTNISMVTALNPVSLPHNGLVLLFGDSKQLTRKVQTQRWVEPFLNPSPSLIDGLTASKMCPLLRLETVFRGHPQLINANSHAAYEGRLRPYHQKSLCRDDNLPRMLGDHVPIPLSTVINHTGLETKEGTSTVNVPEQLIVVQLVKHFVELAAQGGVPWSDLSQADAILVVTFYAAQQRALIDKLATDPSLKHYGREFWATRVLTADKAQAREAEVTIVSCVRSSEPPARNRLTTQYSQQTTRVGFVAQLERGNVATSRSRCARVVVANVESLLWSDFFHIFFSYEFASAGLYQYHAEKIWGSRIWTWSPDWRPQAHCPEHQYDDDEVAQTELAQPDVNMDEPVDVQNAPQPADEPLPYDPTDEVEDIASTSEGDGDNTTFSAPEEEALLAPGGDIEPDEPVAVAAPAPAPAKEDNMQPEVATEEDVPMEGTDEGV